MDPFYIALLLYVVAIVLAILDIFVPSGGMLVVVAAAAGIGSVLFGFRSSATLGMAMLTVVAASIPVLAFVTVKIWPHTPIGRMVILKTPNMESSKPADLQGLDPLVGRVFLAESPLLPAGQIKVGHRHLNAIAEQGIIEKGQAVKVIAIRERNLIVRPTNEPVTFIASVSSVSKVGPLIARDETLSPALPVDERLLELNLLEQSAEELGLDSLDK